jgi:hypothetical protein
MKFRFRQTSTEAIMAKGQKRSSRELKKPKKAAAPKPSGGKTSAFSQTMGAAGKPGGKKS